jgi:phage-related protein (TIGR01555 family)
MSNLTSVFDGFSSILKRLKPINNVTISDKVLTNKEVDYILKNNQLLLRQIEIPAYLATKFYPIITGDSALKSRKIIAYLKKHKWLNKFQKALELANRYGAAYIVIQTVGETTLQSPLKLGEIVKTFIYTHEELQEYRAEMQQIDYSDPEYYLTTQPDIARQVPDLMIHSSRVLAFYGRKRIGYDFMFNRNRHAPTWLGSYPYYLYYQAALEASIAMLKDASVGIYKMQGLVKLLKTAKTQDDKRVIEENLYSRLTSLLDGMSVTNKIIIDAEDEDFNFVERNYNNVEKIVEVFKTAFAEVCDLPNTVLFSSNTEEGLFSNVGMADRQLLASHVNSQQQKQLSPALHILASCYFGTYDHDCDFEYPSTIVLTEAEKAELNYKLVQSHTALIASQVVTPQMIAKRHQGQVIKAALDLTEEEISLIPNTIQELNNQLNQAAQGLKGGNVKNKNSAGYTQNKGAAKN